MGERGRRVAGEEETRTAEVAGGSNCRGVIAIRNEEGHRVGSKRPGGQRRRRFTRRPEDACFEVDTCTVRQFCSKLFQIEDASQSNSRSTRTWRSCSLTPKYTNHHDITIFRLRHTILITSVLSIFRTVLLLKKPKLWRWQLHRPRLYRVILLNS